MSRLSKSEHHILIVEEDVFIALDMEFALLSAGYGRCSIAAHGCDALAVAQDCTFALIDINLCEGRAGAEIAADLYVRYGVRSLLVTANPAQIGTPPEGAHGYVRKPFSALMLTAAIDRVLSGDGHAEPDNDASAMVRPGQYG